MLVSIWGSTHCAVRSSETPSVSVTPPTERLLPFVSRAALGRVRHCGSSDKRLRHPDGRRRRRRVLLRARRSDAPFFEADATEGRGLRARTWPRTATAAAVVSSVVFAVSMDLDQDEALRGEDPLPHLRQREVRPVGHLVGPLPTRATASPRAARLRVPALPWVAPHVAAEAAMSNAWERTKPAAKRASGWRHKEHQRGSREPCDV